MRNMLAIARVRSKEYVRFILTRRLSQNCAAPKTDATSPSPTPTPALLSSIPDHVTYDKLVAHFRTLLLYRNQTGELPPQLATMSNYITNIAPNLSFDQLVSLLDSAILASDEIGNVSDVKTREEQHLVDMLSALKIQSLKVAKDSFGMDRLQKRIEIGYLWSLLDAESVTYSVVRTTGDKEMNTGSVKTFPKLDPISYTEYAHQICSLRRIPIGFHNYYMLYKLYDFLDELPLLNVSWMLDGLSNKGIRLPREHPLTAKMALKLAERILNAEADTFSDKQFSSLFKFCVNISDKNISLVQDLQRIVVKRFSHREADSNIVFLATFSHKTLISVPEEFRQLFRKCLPKIDCNLESFALRDVSNLAMTSEWLCEDEKKELIEVIFKCLREKLASEQSSVLYCLMTATNFAYYRLFDSKVLEMIFTHKNLVTDDGQLLRRLRFSDIPAQMQKCVMLRQLAGLTHIYCKDYTGPTIKDDEKWYEDSGKKNMTSRNIANPTLGHLCEFLRYHLPKMYGQENVSESLPLPHFFFPVFTVKLDNANTISVCALDSKTSAPAARSELMEEALDVAYKELGLNVCLINTRTLVKADKLFFDLDEIVLNFVRNFREYSTIDKKGVVASMYLKCEHMFL